MSDRDTQWRIALLATLGDLETAIAEVGVELEALVAIHRRLAEHTLGFDVLEGTPYDGTEAPKGGCREPEIPDWVNRIED